MFASLIGWLSGHLTSACQPKTKLLHDSILPLLSDAKHKDHSRRPVSWAFQYHSLYITAQRFVIGWHPFLAVQTRAVYPGLYRKAALFAWLSHVGRAHSPSPAQTRGSAVLQNQRPFGLSAQPAQSLSSTCSLVSLECPEEHWSY